MQEQQIENVGEEKELVVSPPRYTEAEINKMIEARTTKKQREDALRTRSVEPKDTLNRNDLCMCGSGLKYKKCCGK